MIPVKLSTSYSYSVRFTCDSNGSSIQCALPPTLLLGNNFDFTVDIFFKIWLWHLGCKLQCNGNGKQMKRKTHRRAKLHSAHTQNEVPTMMTTAQYLHNNCKWLWDDELWWRNVYAIFRLKLHVVRSKGIRCCSSLIFALSLCESKWKFATTLDSDHMIYREYQMKFQTLVSICFTNKISGLAQLAKLCVKSCCAELIHNIVLLTVMTFDNSAFDIDVF